MITDVKNLLVKINHMSDRQRNRLEDRIKPMLGQGNKIKCYHKFMDLKHISDIFTQIDKFSEGTLDLVEVRRTAR